jgi:hypothetical protein
MEELESQNDAAVEGLSAKVKMLKDVSITRVLGFGFAGFATDCGGRGAADFVDDGLWRLCLGLRRLMRL